MKPLLAAIAPPQLLSLEAWAALDEDEPGELVDGVLQEEEMPTVRHELVVTWLIGILLAWARAHGGVVLSSEMKLAIGPRRGRKPDISVFLPPHLPASEDLLVRVAPYMVLEVVSPRPRDTRRDRIDKLHDYARAKAKYYWISWIPQTRTFEVYAIGAARSRRPTNVLAAAAGRLRSVPGFPRLVLDLDAMWAAGDCQPAAERPKRSPARAARRGAGRRSA